MNDGMEQVLSRPLMLERNILRNSFIWMALALLFTGVIAGITAGNEGFVLSLVKNPFLFYGLVIAELAVVWFLSSRVLSLPPMAAVAAFIGYSALNGVTFSVIFLLYTASSIASVFFIAAGMFAVMAVYGFTTKRNLSSIGSYLMMGLVGVVIAGVVNIFLRSDMLSWIVSLVGVGVFVGLTAWDVQKVRAISARYGADVSEASYMRLSIYGALMFYLDFVNLFLHLLRLLGRRR